jgi:hypothetical protein
MRARGSAAKQRSVNIVPVLSVKMTPGICARRGGRLKREFRVTVPTTRPAAAARSGSRIAGWTVEPKD